jgi:hypothetical protein
MELENIVKIVEIGEDGIANEYLSKGYILLCVTAGNMEHSAYYSLGWDKTNGEIPKNPNYRSEDEKRYLLGPDYYKSEDSLSTDDLPDWAKDSNDPAEDK